MPVKVYQSKNWLKRKYLVEKLSPEEIAEMCNVAPMTIYRYINMFGFKR